ncbi:hypothetical protein GLAREA_04032 [Glarea lozoyensis ATCC 20868]|uniref:Uncharacterized protein n=1 Tax=Glarea lozoyensis (strain ATCC 20868 / MF5171) TaxID=1116229 RepID=S3CZM4_GLAL2|nr:uncharacterized protein GLAREA_04032 [Glarea lozoyensis ATCC 20868]EPE31065.1 hypothetical protein GLAREA_04032 [Glarea lozoyensis ATCC 20868]
MSCSREEFPGSYSVILEVKYTGSRGLRQAKIWVSDPRDHAAEYILAIQVAKENKGKRINPTKRKRLREQNPDPEPHVNGLKRKRGRPRKVREESTPLSNSQNPSEDDQYSGIPGYPASSSASEYGNESTQNISPPPAHVERSPSTPVNSAINSQARDSQSATQSFVRMIFEKEPSVDVPALRVDRQSSIRLSEDSLRAPESIAPALAQDSFHSAPNADIPTHQLDHQSSRHVFENSSRDPPYPPFREMLQKGALEPLAKPNPYNEAAALGRIRLLEGEESHLRKENICLQDRIDELTFNLDRANRELRVKDESLKLKDEEIRSLKAERREARKNGTDT